MTRFVVGSPDLFLAPPAFYVPDLEVEADSFSTAAEQFVHELLPVALDDHVITVRSSKHTPYESRRYKVSVSVTVEPADKETREYDACDREADLLTLMGR